jgi:hypothetical protein
VRQLCVADPDTHQGQNETLRHEKEQPVTSNLKRPLRRHRNDGAAELASLKCAPQLTMTAAPE